jgi:hypothetical protein
MKALFAIGYLWLLAGVCKFLAIGKRQPPVPPCPYGHTCVDHPRLVCPACEWGCEEL